MVSNQSSHRIIYIDIARGLGILLVVLGHSDLALVSPYLHQLVYSFHVPLFFFLSGYFFDPGAHFSKFLRKRFRSILQPYLFTILLIFLASISFTNLGLGTAIGRFAKSMYASTEYIWWIPLWYLPSLFVTSLFAYATDRLVFSRLRNRYFRWLFLLTMQAVGVFFIHSFYPFSFVLFGKDYQLYGLPYSLDIVFITSFFYILGREIREFPMDKAFDNKWILVLSGGGLLALNGIFSQQTDLAARVFESFFVNTLEALLGIAFTLSLSKQIASLATRLAATLAYIGQISLYILIFHAPIQEYWGAKIYALAELPALSILFAFLISTGISIGMYKIFVERNPLALYWFGRKSPPPVEHETIAEPSKNQEEPIIKKYGEPS